LPEEVDVSETLSPMTSLANDAAVWTGRRNRMYELRSPMRTYALLRWEPGFKTRAHATTARGEWTFERRTFWYPHVDVRERGVVVATYWPGWLANGRLKSRRGASWAWRSLTVWRRRYGFLDDRRQPLVEFRAHFKLPPEADVRLGDRAFGLDEVPLLVTLGWYLTILGFDDFASGALHAVMRR
jgi:hypothetical protein